MEVTAGKELSRWADAAMYRSEPMPKTDGRVVPRVTLLNATPDPLGTLAATVAMYEGRTVRSLSEVTDDQRRHALAEMEATQLQGPLEVAQFQFLVEGVTRSFTHQMVRERQAFFAQESMRFAVVDDEVWSSRAALPPSLNPSNPNYAGQRTVWDRALMDAQIAYTRLVDSGMPAEDARGLMPHAMTTRLHWVLDLRGLLHVAGLRTCTQAQFEWRLVMAQVAKALRDYQPRIYGAERADAWQFDLIADKLRPVCYQTGRCGFMAKFDRACKIRDRVEANAKLGRPSSEWGEPSAKKGNPGQVYDSEGREIVEAIHNWEWAADPSAARA